MSALARVVTLVLAVGLFAAVRADSAPPTGSFRVLADFPLPAARSAPVDIRWASDRSVFLARLIEGVFEIELGHPLTQIRQPVPAPEVLKLEQLNGYGHLAVTENNLLVASGVWSFAWRPIGGPKGGEILFQKGDFATLHDVDLMGDRILILGLREPIPENRNGGIAWLGSLASGSKDFRILLKDENHELDSETWLSARCAVLPLGAVRFLPGGSFLVVPGFQPGAYMFDREGALIRQWSSQDIGLTTNCSKVPFAALLRPNALPPWLAKHRVLDDILPLPEGPGLLIRSVGKDGKLHWDLTVLKSNGIATYPLPLEGTRPTDRLHGDVRGGKIVLLMANGELWSQEPASFTGRLIVGELAH